MLVIAIRTMLVINVLKKILKIPLRISITGNT